MQGRSLAPAFRGPAKNWRRSFLVEYFAEAQFPRVPGYQAVRTERYKLTRYTDLKDMDEFYDLQNDPEEMKNLIADPSAAKALRETSAELDRLRKETKA
jgi:arylsulfatase A-like enzyme